MNYLIENCFDSQNNRSARRELNKLLYGKSNPYDFIFLFCAANDAPLIIFRDFIFKIIEEKKGNENDDSSEASG